MASNTAIWTNGKTTLERKPVPPPAMILAGRELAAMVPLLENAIYKFNVTHNNKNAELAAIKKLHEIGDKYYYFLFKCKSALKNEVCSMPNERQAYFSPLLEFLVRASDPHNAVPYDKYLGIYRNCIINGKPPNFGFETHAQFKGYVLERAEESLRILKCYMAAMNQSVGLNVEKVELVSLASLIMDTMAKTSVIRFHKEEIFEITKSLANKPDKMHQKQVEMYNAIRKRMECCCRVISKNPGIVYTMEPLLYFELANLVSNAIKATYGAETLLHKGGAPFVYADYDNISTINNPTVEIQLERIDGNDVSIKVADNGIGMSEAMVRKIFNNEETEIIISNNFSPAGIPKKMGEKFVENARKEYAKCTAKQVMSFEGLPGMHITARLFPFIEDLLGAKSVIETKIGSGTTYNLILPADLSLFQY